MRAKSALVLHLGGGGECERLIWVWSVQAQGWMRICTHIRNQGIYSGSREVVGCVSGEVVGGGSGGNVLSGIVEACLELFLLLPL